MATYASDEEQIEALKNWWKENGNSLMIGVVIVLVVLFSSRQWQASNNANDELASDLYQGMLEVAAAGTVAGTPEENIKAGLEINTQLRTDFSKSIYSHYSALLMARLYVEQDELDMAVAELKWLIDNPGLGLFKSVDEELIYTARLRMARIILAQGEPQTALDVLAEIDPGSSFTGSYAEVEGDAYMVLNRPDDARSAYQLALETATNSALLELKLEDLSE